MIPVKCVLLSFLPIKKEFDMPYQKRRRTSYAGKSKKRKRFSIKPVTDRSATKRVMKMALKNVAIMNPRKPRMSSVSRYLLRVPKYMLSKYTTYRGRMKQKKVPPLIREPRKTPERDTHKDPKGGGGGGGGRPGRPGGGGYRGHPDTFKQPTSPNVPLGQNPEFDAASIVATGTALLLAAKKAGANEVLMTDYGMMPALENYY
jgi:hypothetical protein